MKKLYLLIATALLFGITQSFAQVDRDKVIVEIGTGTWCPYCPGSAMGADDLIENGHDVAVIEYHSGDAYQNSSSSARINYYNITGFPTAYFDGLLSVVGGSGTQSMYPQYLSKYNQRIGVQSPFTIDIAGENYGLEDFEATITVEKVGAYNASDLRLHFALTESHIEESWQGMDELNFVERLMLPNSGGTSIDFTSGDIQEVDVSFSLDDDWVFENCEVVAFVQDHPSKEIFQGTKMKLDEFTPMYDNDVTLTNVRNVPVNSCMESVSPVVTIRNNGNATLTQLDFEYGVNGSITGNHQWTGSLEFLESTEVELPSVDFTGEETNTLMVEALNPNGEEDQNSENNTITEDFDMAESVPMEVMFMMRTDGNPEETTWELTNSSGEVVYSGGPYTNSGEMVNVTFELTEDCYNFSLYDDGGDGLTGSGFYMLYYEGNNIIIQGAGFGYQISTEFSADLVGMSENIPDFRLNIYPNPAAASANFRFTLTESSDVTYSIFDMLGAKVMEENRSYNAGQVDEQIDVSGLSKGTYIVKLQIGENSVTRRISILK